MTVDRCLVWFEFSTIFRCFSGTKIIYKTNSRLLFLLVEQTELVFQHGLEPLADERFQALFQDLGNALVRQAPDGLAVVVGDGVQHHRHSVDGGLRELDGRFFLSIAPRDDRDRGLHVVHGERGVTSVLVSGVVGQRPFGGAFEVERREREERFGGAVAVDGVVDRLLDLVGVRQVLQQGFVDLGLCKRQTKKSLVLF